MSSISYINSFKYDHKRPKISLILCKRDKSYLDHSHPTKWIVAYLITIFIVQPFTKYVFDYVITYDSQRWNHDNHTCSYHYEKYRDYYIIIQ